MMASLGIGEVSVYRRLRVAFFSTGDELKSIGTPLATGEVYDSNRYTIYGMLARLDCDVIDMGVVRDVPAALEAAFASAAAAADVVITSGGVSVGEADFVKQLLDKLGEVLFWKIAMKPGRPLAYGRLGARALLRPARQPGVGDGHLLPVRPRGAARAAGAARRRSRCRLFKVPLGAPIRKAPGRTEFQRGDPQRRPGERLHGAHHRRAGLRRPVVDVAANCFIVLPADTGDVAAGELVDVQLLDGPIGLTARRRRAPRCPAPAVPWYTAGFVARRAPGRTPPPIPLTSESP